MSLLIRISMLFAAFWFYVFIGAALYNIMEEKLDNEDQLAMMENLLRIKGKCVNLTLLKSILELVGGVRSEQAQHFLVYNMTKPMWDFSGGVKFSLSVVTTLGNGNLSPKTENGRGFSILYGFLGIPLTISLLRNMGVGIREIFSRIVKLVCPSLAWRGRVGVLGLLQLTWLVLIWLVPSALYSYTLGWSYLKSVFFVFCTQATVGFGDVLVKSRDPYFGYFVFLHTIIGLSWLSGNIALITKIVQAHIAAKQKMELRSKLREMSSDFKELRKRSSKSISFSGDLVTCPETSQGTRHSLRDLRGESTDEELERFEDEDSSDLSFRSVASELDDSFVSLIDDLGTFESPPDK